MPAGLPPSILGPVGRCEILPALLEPRPASTACLAGESISSRPNDDLRGPHSLLLSFPGG